MSMEKHIKLLISFQKNLRRTPIILGTILLTLMLNWSVSYAQEVNRPAVWGIAKMTYYVSDFSVAEAYYGDYLGFEQAFTYQSEAGEVLSFKVNDMQFLEFVEDGDPRSKDFLKSISFDCDDLDQMGSYLVSQGVEIKNKGTDGAGNEVLTIQSTEGYTIKYIHYQKDGLHLQSKGKFLGDQRISHRIHHAGLYVSDILKADQLYRKILGFEEFWSYREKNSSFVKYVYLRIPDCVENIEYALKRNGSHPCFLVDDMQTAIYELKNRRGKNELGHPLIGKGDRWLMNMYNSDGARVEFTEAHTIR